MKNGFLFVSIFFNYLNFVNNGPKRNCLLMIKASIGMNASIDLFKQNIVLAL